MLKNMFTIVIKHVVIKLIYGNETFMECRVGLRTFQKVLNIHLDNDSNIRYVL